MKTLVLTGSDRHMADIHAITWPGKAEWAALHGYDFLNARSWCDTPAFVWQKMALIEYQIGLYDVVVWLDADALITSPYATVESFMPSHAASMFISEDWGGCTEAQRAHHFNTGNFVTRAGEATHALFCEMWRIGRERWWQKWGFEQSSLQDIKRDEALLGRLIEILPGRMLNAVPKAAQDGTNNAWQPGDFLAHLTGIPNERRLELLRNQEWRNA